jgi:hypothetical protein
MTRTAPAAIVNASPRHLLSLDPEGRAAAADAREAYLHEVEAELHRQELALQNLRREVELAKTGFGVAHILANSAEDKLYGRIPGDVIVERGGQEYAVIGVQVSPDGSPFYFVVKPDSYAANLGDGASPVWKSADHFRRP